MLGRSFAATVASCGVARSVAKPFSLRVSTPAGADGPQLVNAGAQPRHCSTPDVSIPLRADASRLGILQDADKTRTDRSQKNRRQPDDRHSTYHRPQQGLDAAALSRKQSNRRTLRCGFGLHSKKIKLTTKAFWQHLTHSQRCPQCNKFHGLPADHKNKKRWSTRRAAAAI